MESRLFETSSDTSKTISENVVGEVVYYSQNGYGFCALISSEPDLDGLQAFFHISWTEPRRELSKGDVVRFDLEENPDKTPGRQKFVAKRIAKLSDDEVVALGSMRRRVRRNRSGSSGTASNLSNPAAQPPAHSDVQSTPAESQ